MSARLVVWSVVTVAICLSLLGTQLGQLCLLAVLTHPPPADPFVRGTCDIAGCVQNISQSQPVQPVAICDSTVIAIALLYFWCKSYMATIRHKKAIIL